MTLLVAVPGLGALLPLRYRRPLLFGGVAFAVAALLGALEWRDRPIVVAGTLANIALITFVTRHAGRLRSAETQPDPVQEESPAPEETGGQRTISRQLDDVRVELRALPAPGQGRLRTIVHDLRPTPFGVRLLVTRFSDDSPTTRTTAANLLHRWGRAAAEHSSLPDVTRSLNALLASAGGEGARSVLICVKGDGEASVVCCGHPPSLLVSQDTAQPLNIVSPLPPLGRCAQAGRELPIYTTSVRLAPGRRLLLDTAERTDDAPLLPELDAPVLRDLEPGAFLDQVSTALQNHAARGEALLALVEHTPQAAASLAPAAPDETAGHRPGTAA